MGWGEAFVRRGGWRFPPALPGRRGRGSAQLWRGPSSCVDLTGGPRQPGASPAHVMHSHSPAWPRQPPPQPPRITHAIPRTHTHTHRTTRGSRGGTRGVGVWGCLPPAARWERGGGRRSAPSARRPPGLGISRGVQKEGGVSCGFGVSRRLRWGRSVPGEDPLARLGAEKGEEGGAGGSAMSSRGKGFVTMKHGSKKWRRSGSWGRAPPKHAELPPCVPVSPLHRPRPSLPAAFPRDRSLTPGDLPTLPVPEEVRAARGTGHKQFPPQKKKKLNKKK